MIPETMLEHKSVISWSFNHSTDSFVWSLSSRLNLPEVRQVNTSSPVHQGSSMSRSVHLLNVPPATLPLRTGEMSAGLSDSAFCCFFFFIIIIISAYLPQPLLPCWSHLSKSELYLDSESVLLGTPDGYSTE